mmetsp:Transcript_24816/g.11871  ORF Transcript_24816/g.11871 Transcript_24816/m.11871 type:complete len:111 (-) Transcript_24816:696-1028(-)
MGQAGGAGQTGSGGFRAFVPLILMFVIFYFLLIRPQQKKTKGHRAMISALKKGDRVVTGGGIHGRITALDDTVVSVEVADEVNIKVNRGNIATLVVPKSEVPAKNKKSNK